MKSFSAKVRQQDILSSNSKKEQGRPKRPLSAYNLFFQHQRKTLLERLPVRKEGAPRRSHGKLGFKDMARIIGAQWRTIDANTKAHFEALAVKDKQRQQRELKAWRAQQQHQQSAVTRQGSQNDHNNDSVVVVPEQSSSLPHDRAEECCQVSVSSSTSGSSSSSNSTDIPGSDDSETTLGQEDLYNVTDKDMEDVDLEPLPLSMPSPSHNHVVVAATYPHHEDDELYPMYPLETMMYNLPPYYNHNDEQDSTIEPLGQYSSGVQDL